MKNATPSKRSIDRAKNNPEQATATTLYALAEIEKRTMEEIMQKPLWFAGRRIDGYMRQDDRLFAYSKDIPKYPPVRALYVFHVRTQTENGILETDMVAMRRQVKTFEFIRGIVVFEMRLTNIVPDDDIRAIKYPRTVVEWYKEKENGKTQIW